MKTKKNEGDRKNIFEILLEKNICFAVIDTQFRFSGDDLERYSREYFIILDKSDKEFAEYRFVKIKGFYDVFERKLNDDDILVLNKLIENKVLTKYKYSEKGRIYELKDNSFRDFYERKMNRIFNLNIFCC